MPISISRLRILTGAVVIAAAGGSGYFMQTGQTPAPGVAASVAGTGLDMAQQDTALVAEPVSDLVSDLGPVAPIEPETMAIPLVTRDLSQPVLATPTSPPAIQAAPGPDVILLAAAEPAENIGPAGPEPVLATPSVAKGCDVGFTAIAAPGAMVELTLEAPCYAGESVDIFHAGIRFGAVLDENGLTEVSVPALEEDALFNALFTDGRTEATDILMLTVSDYQRVALFWKGTTG
ncbi:MAG TPA: hypothetical protein ENK41_04500, partial [Rhodobacteraceae bacterium]|nr:hypothetical protein [Paracoccaceae bacterium]